MAEVLPRNGKQHRRMAAFRLSALFAATIVAGATPGPSASPATSAKSRPHCVFENSYTFSSAPCAPFRKVGIRVQAAISSSAFGADAPPEDIRVLDDGSVMVQTDRYGLYRIAGRRPRVLWWPAPRCDRQPHFEFEFTGSFDDELLTTVDHTTSAAVRADGSLAFRLPLAFDSVAQDANGVVWLLRGRYPDQTLYAYFSRTRVQVTLQSPKDGYKVFLSPNGYVYASNSDGLFELDSQPKVRARLVHGAIRRQDVTAYRGLDFFVSPIQAVGRDGSLWASTPTQVIHVHPDGTPSVMRFTEPPRSMTMPWPAIPLTMTRDGAVWTTFGKTARIDNSDRIQVLTLPQSDGWSVRFGPDSSLWVLAHDARTGQPLGIVNVVPADVGRRATAWPFKPLTAAGSPTPFVPCPRPTTPPTPTPQLPPKNGAINFVYVASETSHEVWGYWAGRSGKLTPVRGAPFPAGNGPVNVTIDPAGRHLYVGTWYDGIFAFTIDARSGTLAEIRGSPFGAASGPTIIVLDRSGRYAFAANLNAKNVTGYAVDGESGVLRPLAWSPMAMNHYPYRLTVNPRRDVAYFVTDRDLETFGTSGGVLTNLSTIAPARGNSLYIDPQGRWAYLTSDPGGTIAVYGVDPRTGVLMPPTAPTVKAGNEPRAIATGPRGRFLYVTNIPSEASKATILGYRIDPRNGTLRALPTSPYNGAPGGNGMTVTPDGAFLYTTNFDTKAISGFAIDSTSGALWPLPSSPFKTGNTPQGIVSCRRVGDSCKTAPAIGGNI